VKKAAAVAKLPKSEQVAALEVAAGAMAEVGVDLVRELEHADTEIRKLTAQVESLSKPDQAAESQKWQQKFYELEGRLNQCMTTKTEAEKSAKYASGMLAKIRKMLGVEKNGEIEAAIMGLRKS
jgi:primosomal protein N''